jgi:D-lactate dehydrogenase
MGPARGDDQGAVTAAMQSLLAKAGCDVAYPEGLADLCCGLSFESKGYPAEAEHKARELEVALLAATDGGKHPVLFDTSPCAQRMKKLVERRLSIHDPVEFIDRFLLARLELRKEPGPVALHVPCSAVTAGLVETFRRVASACAQEVVLPASIGCCGFAGDRGFTHPELNASALALLPGALPDSCEAGYSASRTCEIGLSLHSGIPYRSLAVLVDRCASPRPTRSPAPPDAPAAARTQPTRSPSS